MSNDNLWTRRQDLAPLLNARSVAIVGVSQPGRFGGMLFENLEKFGYEGRIYLVNPRYESLYDRPCYASLRNLPETPDCAILATPNHRLIAALEWNCSPPAFARTTAMCRLCSTPADSGHCW